MGGIDGIVAAGDLVTSKALKRETIAWASSTLHRTTFYLNCNHSYHLKTWLILIEVKLHWQPFDGLLFLSCIDF